jgi:hypothetical protein
MDAAHKKAGVDLICLAGFMRIISPWFVNRWKGKMINIHPSLLPAYKGLQTHRAVLAAGETFTGCTVHYVDEGVDTGAIILQAKVPVEPGDTEEILAARVLKEEHRIYPEAVRLIATGAVRYEGGEVMKIAKTAVAILVIATSLLGTSVRAESVHAGEIGLRGDTGLPASSFACKKSDECATVDFGCGPSIGVRADHQKKAQEAIRKNHKGVWGVCDSASPTTSYAVCENGECRADYKRR